MLTLTLTPNPQLVNFLLLCEGCEESSCTVSGLSGYAVPELYPYSCWSVWMLLLVSQSTTKYRL